MEIDTTPELVFNVYSKLRENIVNFRNVVDRPLTLTEKILSGHFNEINEKNYSSGKDYVFLNLIELHYKMLLDKWLCFNLCKQN